MEGVVKLRRRSGSYFGKRISNGQILNNLGFWVEITQKARKRSTSVKLQYGNGTVPDICVSEMLSSFGLLQCCNVCNSVVISSSTF